MNTIKTIIFDLGGVVFENGTRKLRHFLNEKYKISPDLLTSIFYGEKSQLLRAGKIEPQEFWNYISASFKQENIGMNLEELRDMWYGLYKPNINIFTLLENLKKNYELGIVSGNIKERILFLEERYHFKKYFDWELYSFDVGFNKPDAKLYKAIFSKTKNLSENCLYIDDKEVFLNPANNIGIKTLLFKSYEELLFDLANLKII